MTGEAISGANFVKDFLASLKDFTGGRSGAYEEELSKARNIAFDEMNQKSREMGANGVVGIDIDYGTLGESPSHTTLTVTFRVGGGVNSNIATGDLTTIDSSTIIFRGTSGQRS